MFALKKAYLVAAVGLVAALVKAQDLTSDARTVSQVRPPLKPGSVLDNLQDRARRLRDRIEHPRSREEVDRVRPELKKRLTLSLGYHLLPWPPDLRPQVSGRVVRSGYAVHKVLLQTIRNVIVPANLYVPDALTGRAPALLFPSGHSRRGGKASEESQTFCIDMVRLGFIVLIPDSIDEGERDAPSKLRDPNGLLVGLSEAGIVEYEMRCELEYLRSRPDVDPARIGLFGVNGGGLNALITAALDDQIAAVAVDGIRDFFDEIQRMRATDWNHAEDHSQLIPGILQFANMQELLALIAPRTIMIIAGTETRDIYDYGHLIYSTLGAPSNMHLFEGGGDWSDNAHRAAVCGFFLSALMNKGYDAPALEGPPTVLADANLLACLPDGEFANAAPGIAEAVQLLVKRAFSTPASALPAFPVDAPERGRPSIVINSLAVQRENIDTETGIQVPVTILRPGQGEFPGGGTAGMLLAIDDIDKERLAADPIVQEAMRRDWLVLEMDPRGFGELAIDKPEWVFRTSLLLGENFVSSQARDIRSILDFCETTSPGKMFALYARGPNSSMAAAYAISMNHSDDKLAWAILRGGFTSISQFLEISPVRDRQSIPYYYYEFGALRFPDLPELLSRSKVNVFVIDPVDTPNAHSGRSKKMRIVSADQFIGYDW